MNRPACSLDNREGASFCRHCGKPLAELPASETPMVPDDGLVEDASEKKGEAGEDATGATFDSDTAGGGSPGDPMAGYRPGPEPAEALKTDSQKPVEDLTEEREPVVEDPEQAQSIPEDEIELEAVPDGGLYPVEAESDLPAESYSAVEAEKEPTDRPIDGESIPDQEQGQDMPEPEMAEPEMAERIEPLEPGTLVAERYLLIDAVDAAEGEVLYRARDLKSCWHCGFDENVSDDPFCARCGASLDRWPDVDLVEVLDPEAEPSGDRVVVLRLRHEGRTLLLLEPLEREPETALPPLRLVVGQSSDTGLVRGLDEDSLLTLNLSATYESRTQPVLGVFAVADGMGGHAGGEIASKLALQVMSREVIQTLVLPELAGESLSDDLVAERLRLATTAANDAVYLARQKRENDMGTTVTMLYVRDDQFFVAHVGDCRAYRWNQGGLQQLTQDHSLVASMVISGQIGPEEIYTHPQRSVIYRCVGDQAMVDVDTDVQELRPGDRLIVCCDGLWEMIRNEGIDDVMMQESDPQAACDLLVSRANAAGGEDNISVIVVQVETL